MHARRRLRELCLNEVCDVGLITDRTSGRSTECGGISGFNGIAGRFGGADEYANNGMSALFEARLHVRPDPSRRVRKAETPRILELCEGPTCATVLVP
jgi:hypothetical protein